MQFVATKCAICQTYANSQTIYDANLELLEITPEVFSARRIPDRIHYRWVRCKKCNLFRSDPVTDLDLGELYSASTFDYSSEVSGLQKTYMEITRRSLAPRTPEGSILEIGGGNGFFLEIALESGFTNCIAVEPSLNAVENSRPDIRSKTFLGFMKHDLVPDNSQNFIAMFHVMDHLSDPLETLRACVNALMPGGTLLVAVHDVESWSAKFLRSKSPIFDVEHTYLFSKSTGKLLFELAGLMDVKTSSYRNSYSLAYLVQLLPLPRRLKLQILNGFLQPLLRKVILGVNLGNIWISGRKPEPKKNS